MNKKVVGLTLLLLPVPGTFANSNDVNVGGHPWKHSPKIYKINRVVQRNSFVAPNIRYRKQLVSSRSTGLSFKDEELLVYREGPSKLLDLRFRVREDGDRLFYGDKKKVTSSSFCRCLIAKFGNVSAKMSEAKFDIDVNRSIFRSNPGDDDEELSP